MIDEAYGHMSKRGQKGNVEAIHLLEDSRNDCDELFD